ncbi:MAG: helix-turn-helix transcriptional regulator [Ruminococcaceae bacterium]|nr:helix-turn-helix transcriptional regulator [Oscillospiraceae bacterium]
MKETIGQVIRRLRKERGITQEEMADMLGVTAQAVSKWENDVGIPDVSQFVPIANLFDISMDTLFSRENKDTEEQVQEFLRALDEKDQDYYSEFQELSKALRKYPNHPKLLKRIVNIATVMKPKDSEQTKKVFEIALESADRFIRNCSDQGQIIEMKAKKIDLLSHAGYYAEAEALAHEFNIPIVNEHSYMARICRQQKAFSEEIRHRQESIARLLTSLADEIAELGTAYRENGQPEEALQVHLLNLKLPYAVHGEEKYHAPLYNFHSISGFEAAYCLVLLKRYDEAIDLIERIFEYAAVQCACCNDHTPLSSPLLCNISMELFHGELRMDDYLWKIELPEFAPLHDYPRFQTLIKKFKEFADEK